MESENKAFIIIVIFFFAVFGMILPAFWESHSVFDANIVHKELYQGDNAPERILTVEANGQQYTITVSCTYYDNATTVQMEKTTLDFWWIFLPNTAYSIAGLKPGC